MFCPLKITFILDGTGIYYDLNEPIMLDGVLTQALCRWHVHGEPPARDEEPDDIPLPLGRWEIGGTWGWRASALFPDGATIESLQFWRKRFRQSRAELTDGSPNLTNGPYREWNVPLPLLLTPRLVGYAFGNRRSVLRALRQTKFLGKKRSAGRGAVIGVEVEKVKEDWSLWKEGRSMRWLPSRDGTRFVRPRPPYWSQCGRVLCAEISAGRCRANPIRQRETTGITSARRSRTP